MRRLLARAAGLTVGVGAGLVVATAVGPEAPARPALAARPAVAHVTRDVPEPSEREPAAREPGDRDPEDREPAGREPGGRAGREHGEGSEGDERGGRQRDRREHEGDERGDRERQVEARPRREAGFAPAVAVRGRLRLVGPGSGPGSGRSDPAPHVERAAELQDDGREAIGSGASRPAPEGELIVVAVHRGPAGVQARQVPVGPGGRFELAGLPPGDVTLHAVRDGVALPGARRLELREGEPVEVDLEPAPAPVALRGRVLDAAGRPLAGARVGPAGAPPVATGADGRFALTDLPLGLDGGLVTLEASHRDHAAVRGEVALLPPPAPAPEVTLRLPAGATLVARVVDRAGLPVTGADVALSGDRPGAAPTGPDGTSRFTGLPPGAPLRVALLDGEPVEVVLRPGEVREVLLRRP